MKTIYTLIIAMTLVGCSWDISEARGTTTAFLNNCKLGTVITNTTNVGNDKTLTITCTKDNVR